MGNNLGPILKTLRKNKNMTIEELSKKTCHIYYRY